MTEFALNDAASVTVTRVGRGGYAVSRVEHVLRNPEAVAAVGYAQSYRRDPDNFYPGMRAAVPEAFATVLSGWLSGMVGAPCRPATSYFSVVTTSSSELLPIQRIPHYDATDPGLFAAVLYLCHKPFCGTSFYRHRKTGFEEITAANRRNYQLALDHELRLHGPPERQYINGDSALFERIHSNELEFNSAVVYPGRALHAGNIAPVFTSPRSQQEWRLTVTSLIVSDSSAAGP